MSQMRIQYRDEDADTFFEKIAKMLRVQKRIAILETLTILAYMKNAEIGTRRNTYLEVDTNTELD
jgi:hypothetical protein